MRMPRLLCAVVAAAGLIALLAGCDLQTRQFQAGSRYYVKPTVAVVSFQSSGVSGVSSLSGSGGGGWNVGAGLADVITDELLKTERFHVVERGNIDAVLQELQIQQGKLTRPEGKAPIGRLKNVEYLVKGRVTDFGHISRSDAWARMDMLNVFGARDKAVLRMVFQVIEVESGRIVLSKSIESSVSSGQVGGNAAYKNVGFGGTMFYRTPLGRVTADATKKAVAAVVEAVASQPWRPQVALVEPERVILNGGQNRGIAVGQIYRACESGQAITDPQTGDKIDYLPGRQIGQVQIIEVHEQYAVAKSLTQSTYQVGQRLERLKQ